LVSDNLSCSGTWGASFSWKWFLNLAPQDAVQGLLAFVQGLFAETVVHVAAAPVRLDETGLPQDPQVLRDRPLRDAQSGHDGSDAQRMLLQEAQDLDPGPHGNSLKATRQVLDIVRHTVRPQY
jgi:hypothetical protein